MLGLPTVTEVSKQLPKKAIYAKFNMNTAQREKFDADVSRITIVNEVSSSTVNIAAGETVKAFFVLHLTLKHREYDERLIVQLSRLIDQNMIFVLEYDGEAQLAVYRSSKVIRTGWQKTNTIKVTLNGITLDAVWENVIIQIGGISVERDNTLDEQIAIDERRAKLQKEIDRLEKLARIEKQPRKKFELVKKINSMRNSECEMRNSGGGKSSE